MPAGWHDGALVRVITIEPADLQAVNLNNRVQSTCGNFRVFTKPTVNKP